MAITALPMLDRFAANFKTAVNTFFGSQLPQFSVEVEAARLEINANQLAAQQAAANSLASQLLASTAAQNALATSNYKGTWTSLGTGAVNKPASVSHNGKFWALLNNLTNASTSQPGVSADWIDLAQGTRPTQIVTGAVTGVAGVLYILTSASTSLTAPASWTKYDYFGWVDCGAPSSCYIDYGTTKVRTRTPGQMLNNSPFQKLELVYENSTVGLI